MAKFSELSSVAHNIAHHAGSGLSHISPHLAQALRSAGNDTAHIELLAENPYPSQATELKPLRLALVALRETVESLLQKHGFQVDTVTSIVLHATPASWDKQGYSLHTRAVIIASNGRVYDSGWLR